MILKDTINTIMEAVDVADVISDFVNLKKRGSSLMACCPFHNEKTPSFHVSAAKGIYKCFGCGRGGDSVRFLMDLEGLSYPDALRWLAKKYHIEVQEKEFSPEQVAVQTEKEELFIAMDFARKIFQENLKNGQGQALGYSYYKERGFSESIIEKFELGYAEDERDHFYKKAIAVGLKTEILEKAGLTFNKDDHWLDRFRGRTTFPIHNLSGKVIAFGARILGKNPKVAKYINSPETELYVKSKIVYGIFQAKTAIRQKNECYLVEGYTDVISLHQVGIENVVASSGTSLTVEQVQLIRRFTNNITVLYDGDNAGIKASIRGMDILLQEDINVKSIVFPDGEDPDSFMKKVGETAFEKYIGDNKQDFIRFRTKIELAEIQNDPAKKAEFVSEIVKSINLIPNAIKRQVYYQEAAQLLNIDESVLLAEGNRLQVQKNRSVTKNDGGKVDTYVLTTLNLVNDEVSSLFFYREFAILRLLFDYGSEIIDSETSMRFADYFLNEISDVSFKDKYCDKIFTCYKNYYHQYTRCPGIPELSVDLDDASQKMLFDHLENLHTLSPKWESYEIIVPEEKELLEKISYDLLLRFWLLRKTTELEELTEVLDDEMGEDLLEKALQEFKEKQEAKNYLAAELGQVVGR